MYATGNAYFGQGRGASARPCWIPSSLGFIYPVALAQRSATAGANGTEKRQKENTA